MVENGSEYLTPSPRYSTP